MLTTAAKPSISHRQPLASSNTPLKLPKVARSQLDVKPIDWTGLTRRFMNPGELEVLVALISSVNPKSVIEIGVNEGRTAKALLGNIPSIERYVGIDVPVGYKTAKDVQRREVPVQAGHMAKTDPHFELLLRPRGSLDLMPEDLHACDAIFIDGDHGFEAVLHDTALARSLVRKGGIIVWHDYHGQDTVDVRRVLEVLHAHTEDSQMKYVEGTWLAFERVQ